VRAVISSSPRCLSADIRAPMTSHARPVRLLELRHVNPPGSRRAFSMNSKRQLLRGNHLARERYLAASGRQGSGAARAPARCAGSARDCERQLAVGAGTHTQVIPEGPVVKVVPALLPGARVGRTSYCENPAACRRPAHALSITAAASSSGNAGGRAGEYRARLERQLIVRQVRRRERQRRSDSRPAPALSWPGRAYMRSR